MEKLDYVAVAEKAMDQIRRSAFLTVKAGDALNTMTIGWAAVGYVWSQPVFMVAVRNSNHTFGIMEKAADFIVSVPTTDMQGAINFCGSRSGRDQDKFKACGLETAEAQKVTSPIIKTAGIHFECKIVLKAAMDPRHLDEAYEKLYPKKDYHTLYFGEIQDCYEL